VLAQAAANIAPAIGSSQRGAASHIHRRALVACFVVFAVPTCARSLLIAVPSIVRFFFVLRGV
jgi:hypothetical protein